MSADGTPAPRRVRTVRFQLTLVSSLLVAVALTIAGVSMAVVLHHLLTRSADTAGTDRAQQIADSLTAGGLSAVSPAMLMPAGDIDVIQVIDGDGTVLRSSSTAVDDALANPTAPGVLEHVSAGPAGGDYRSTVLGAATPDDGDLTVVVAFQSRPIDQTVITVITMCCLVFPVVVLIVGLLTYRFASRALQSVEDIRAEAAEITGGDLSRRLPVPEADDEIAALATTMNEMLARVERARAEQSQFVNDASHELNSPLTSILGIVEFAAGTDAGIDADTVRTLLLPESLQLQQLVADLLFLARADEHGVPKSETEIDLDDIVGGEVSRLRRTTTLRVDADIAAARIRGDHAQLTRALRNLADNAVVHADSAVAVTMAVDEERREVTVSVSDDGPGIPEADRERVFERFVRLDDARERRTGGSGLGLAIVTEIAQAHGGSVRVAPTASGTTMLLTLPISDTPRTFG